MLRVLSVLLLCSFLAGGSLLAWRTRPAVPALPRVVTVTTVAPRALPAPTAAPAARELPWVNPHVLPGVVRLEDQLLLGEPVVSMVLSRDASRVAVRTSEGTVSVLRRNGETLALERTIPGVVAAYDLAPAGHALLTINEAGTLHEWSLEDPSAPPRELAPEAESARYEENRPSWRRSHAERFIDRIDAAGAPVRTEEDIEEYRSFVEHAAPCSPHTHASARGSSRLARTPSGQRRPPMTSCSSAAPMESSPWGRCGPTPRKLWGAGACNEVRSPRSSSWERTC